MNAGRSHCDILLNNICEVFNRRLVEGRDKPIISCLDYIREYLMKRIVIVQSEIEKHDGPLTPNVTNLFQLVKKEAGKLKVSIMMSQFCLTNLFNKLTISCVLCIFQGTMEWWESIPGDWQGQ